MSKKKSGLGKGLGALIRAPEEMGASVASGNNGLQMVAVGSIRPNPHQPRTEFDPDKLTELTNSIREHGLLQPLVVTPDGEDTYILIAGERRWRASQRAGLATIPVVIKNDTTPQEMLELALIENIQRADLNPLEEAQAYFQLIEDYGLTQEEVAERVGKARSTVANAVRLLDLAPQVQEALTDGEISSGHARTLASPFLSHAQQCAILGTILKNGLSVRQVEEIVKKLKGQIVPTKRQRAQLPPEIADVERQFAHHFGTHVEIKRSKDGGRVVIHYYSDEELNAIYDSILGSS